MGVLRRKALMSKRPAHEYAQVNKLKLAPVPKAVLALHRILPLLLSFRLPLWNIIAGIYGI
jgi:hypothetical protein